MEEENLQGKYFSITDPKEVNTIIYQVNRTEKEFLDRSPRFTVERLAFSEQLVGDRKRKTFFVDNPAPEGNPLVFLSFGKDKVVVTSGFLDYDEVKISKKPMPMKLSTIYNEKETVYREFEYTPNMKRPISIIDPETTEEVKPTLYFDEKANEVKGKCTLKAQKQYFAFEVSVDKRKKKRL